MKFFIKDITDYTDFTGQRSNGYIHVEFWNNGWRGMWNLFLIWFWKT